MTQSTETCARCGHPNSHSEEDGPCDYIMGFADDANINEPNCCYCPAFISMSPKRDG